MLNSAEHEIYLALKIYGKMLTIVGILTFIRRIYKMTRFDDLSLKIPLILAIFDIYEQFELI